MKTGQKILGMLCLCTMASMGFASKYSSSKFSETEMCGGNAVYQQALDDMRRYVKIDDKKALSKMLRYPFWVIIEDRGIEDKSQGSWYNHTQRFYVNNPTEFVALYPKFMLPVFKSAILSLSDDQVYARTSAYAPEAHPLVLVLSKDDQLLELYGKSKNSNDKACEQVEIEFYRMMVNPNKS